jgi:hypothetical protein
MASATTNPATTKPNVRAAFISMERPLLGRF